MEIAVLSDIHSNYIALERCIQYARSRNINIFIFLGDYIGELAYPEKTMQLLYEIDSSYNCYFIKGNKEEYWLKYHSGGEKGWKDKNSASGALLYAYNSLSCKDLDFFARLHHVRKVKVDRMPPFLICHGSPNATNEKLLPNDSHTAEIINSLETSLILCGHTHVQNKIAYKEKYVLNPGAVGMPFFSGGKTQFMILHGDDGKWSEEFISLGYDVDRVIKELYESKLIEHAPYWSVISESILSGGNTSHSKILSRVMELCREETDSYSWPDIPEYYWEQAVKEIL